MCHFFAYLPKTSSFNFPPRRNENCLRDLSSVSFISPRQGRAEDYRGAGAQSQKRAGQHFFQALITQYVDQLKISKQSTYRKLTT